MQEHKTIIWDWNGTLLNDTGICIDAMNQLLSERKLEKLDEATYREIFTFPVRDYYLEAGFDFNKEPFEKPALEFIEEYSDRVKQAALFDDARHTLELLQIAGHEQVILSAMEQDTLLELVRAHGIDHFFRSISGIDNHYAAGKVELGRRLLAGLNGDSKDVLMVGDTIHDHEVGQALGIEVILVARGHQSEQRLLTTGRAVAGSLEEITGMI